MQYPVKMCIPVMKWKEVFRKVNHKEIICAIIASLFRIPHVYIIHSCKPYVGSDQKGKKKPSPKRKQILK